jgi:hypothetical protein
MEIWNVMIEGLVDIRAPMFVMAISVVKKLGIMHLISKTKNYKTTFGTITITLGRIINLPMKVGNINYNMVFLIVNTNTYDILLDLYFLMKVGAIVDVEKGMI